VYTKGKESLIVMCHTACTKIQHFIHVCSCTDKTAADPMTWGGGDIQNTEVYSIFFSGLNSHLLTEAVCQEIW